MRLGNRIWLVAIGAALLGAVAVGGAAWRLLEAEFEARFAGHLHREAEYLAATLPLGGPAGSVDLAGPRDLANAVSLAGARLHARVTVVARDGRVLADTERGGEDLAKMDNHLGRPEVAAALAGGSGRAKRWSATVGRDLLYVARRIDRDTPRDAAGGGGGIGGVVRLAVPVRFLIEGERAERKTLAAAALAAFVLSGLLAAFLTRRLSRPIEALSADALAISGGDWERAIDETREDEVGDLARAVAKMRTNLVEALRRASRERALLESMVESIEEGVLLVDPDLRISFANERARRLLRMPPAPEGRPLVEVARTPELLEAFTRAVSEGARQTLRLRLPLPDGEARLELRVAPYESRGRAGRQAAVGLLLDVSKIEAVEQMRRQFIADVSHELRTPLTAIKTATETLVAASAEIPAELARFPAIARARALRMEALLDDLTDLSLIETGAAPLHREPLSASEIAEDVADEVRGKSPREAAPIRVDVPADLAVDADRRRLVQALVNLVDNAVKFSDGSGEVVIRGARADRRTVFEVSDRGPGIAAKDQERIFQRFARVEPARGRPKEGTGLGLAIVKHIALLHGGTVAVSSVVGEGSTFRLEIPDGERSD